ncbi:MAG: hypothetical protein COA42_15605 [Alteromonadaceae bacterium]|nr:MAG: hypothetical protein COA42_15605 [Alteromonadaceae bacterium]
MKKPLKIGLDIHGVIDTFPLKFKLLSAALVNDGCEVHIVTGLRREASIDQLLLDAGIQFTHYFSIVTHLEDQGLVVDWREGLPYADEEKWNLAKSEYCTAQNIDFMFDDSPTYLGTFSEIDTTYLHVINPDRKVYVTR